MKRLVFPNSPLLPIFDPDKVVSHAIKLYEENHDPAFSVAKAIIQLMAEHARQICSDKALLVEFDMNNNNLLMLAQGYSYPISAITLSAVCLEHDEQDYGGIVENSLTASSHLITLLIQDNLQENIRATTNILRIDPSGAHVFEFLKKYPCFKDEHFLAGMEIAAIVYFGIAQKFAKKTGKDDWLHAPLDHWQTE